MNLHDVVSSNHQLKIYDGRVKRSFKTRISGYHHAKTMYVTLISSFVSSPFFPFAPGEEVFLTLDDGKIVVSCDSGCFSTKLTKHKKARTLYLTLPSEFVSDPSFPFKVGDIIRIWVDPKNHRLIITPEKPIIRNSRFKNKRSDILPQKTNFSYSLPNPANTRLMNVRSGRSSASSVYNKRNKQNDDLGYYVKWLIILFATIVFVAYVFGPSVSF